MALRKGILTLSNTRCVVQQALRVRSTSTQTVSKDSNAEAMKPGQTHFGFEVVDEVEKTKKGNICYVDAIYSSINIALLKMYSTHVYV